VPVAALFRVYVSPLVPDITAEDIGLQEYENGGEPPDIVGVTTTLLFVHSDAEGASEALKLGDMFTEKSLCVVQPPLVTETVYISMIFPEVRFETIGE
jgi:hypothetical protein